MDNQQAKPIELSWLAGLTDGEGTIGLYRYMNGKHLVLKPRFQICTTSPRLVKRVLEIVEPLGCNLYVSQAEQRPNWKERYTIVSTKHAGCEKILSLLSPFLVEKKPQAELLLSFLKSRKEAKYGDGYSNNELATVEALKQTNFRGINFPRLGESSEAIRAELQEAIL